ncbi:MAG TPA: hypothetical protein VJ476_04230 [Rhizomicrobium sp.]|nr:hypothetical protein [Rhizomicrobium sp.]
MTPTIRLVLAAMAFTLSPALAQTTDIDAFKDAPDDAKVHSASGFVCPLYIAHFERDAYGERDPELGSDFCAYSRLDGVYGTITLTPLKSAYDPKTALVPEFTEQEGIGGKIVDERTLPLGGSKTPMSVYTRTYETAALETLHYRILFSSGTFGAWALEATVEFATPRDDQAKNDFLDAVFAEALTHVAKLPAATLAPTPAAH